VETNGYLEGGWGDYSGSVVAEKCDTFGGLAQQITGFASDKSFLQGGMGNVEIGQVVDIAPLLAKFEDRIRNNVVRATGQFKLTWKIL
jgi:hypothetical protein